MDVLGTEEEKGFSTASIDTCSKIPRNNSPALGLTVDMTFQDLPPPASKCDSTRCTEAFLFHEVFGAACNRDMYRDVE